MSTTPSPSRLTAESITDDQINRARDMALATGNRRLVQECNLALNLPTGFDRSQWRGHIAALLNARTPREEVGR